MGRCRVGPLRWLKCPLFTGRLLTEPACPWALGGLLLAEMEEGPLQGPRVPAWCPWGLLRGHPPHSEASAVPARSAAVPRLSSGSVTMVTGGWGEMLRGPQGSFVLLDLAFTGRCRGDGRSTSVLVASCLWGHCRDRAAAWQSPHRCCHCPRGGGGQQGGDSGVWPVLGHILWETVVTPQGWASPGLSVLACLSRSPAQSRRGRSSLCAEQPLRPRDTPALGLLGTRRGEGWQGTMGREAGLPWGSQTCSGGFVSSGRKPVSPSSRAQGSETQPWGAGREQRAPSSLGPGSGLGFASRAAPMGTALRGGQTAWKPRAPACPCVPAWGAASNTHFLCL